ncbi:MAG: outer membrane beta-barrel protein [Psychromonas sp.]
MKNIKTLTLLCLALPTFFSYGSGLYLGIQGGYGVEKDAKLKYAGGEQVLIKDHDTGVGSIKAGYDFNRFFGTELRVGKANDRSIMDSHASAYLKAQYPLQNDLTFYALLGGSHVLLAEDYFPGEALNSVSFGAGMRIPLSDTIGLNVEFMETSSHKYYQLQSFQVGLDYRF